MNSAYRMNIQHVHSEVISRQVHGLEDFLECHGLLLLGLAHHRVRLGLQSLLDEAK